MAVAVTNVSKAAVMPLIVWLSSSCRMLSKPALPGTSAEGVGGSERDLDQRRRRGDLDVRQPKRSSESQDPVLEVGGRVAGLVADTHEPDQELDGRVRRLERCHRGLPVQTVSSPARSSCISRRTSSGS